MLPYGKQLIEDDDVAAVADALRSGWLTTGPAVERFEAQFADVTEAAHAVVCSSGTAALHLAMLASGIGPGDVILVPSITFVATANCGRYVGAEVRFVDVDPATGLATTDHFAAALDALDGAQAKALLPVHVAGQSEEPLGLRDLARDRGVMIVEDACHALGTVRTVGNEKVPAGACRHSDMAVFSFHPVKTMAMGEGGAITTNDATLAEALRQFRAHGITRQATLFENGDLARDAGGTVNAWYYEMSELGYNYRASDIHCALGCSQLAKLPRFAAERRRLANLYDELLAPLAPVVRPNTRMPDCEPAWHLYAVQIDYEAVGRSRNEVMSQLRASGIGTQVHYIPVHLQPYYRHRYGPLDLPGARQYYERTLSLPLFVGLTDDDVSHVVKTLQSVIGL